MYRIVFTDQAKEDLKRLRKYAPTAVKKLEKLLVEVSEHPSSGTGQVELLKHYKEETWSRRINKEHRLVYRIYDDVIEVLILSAYGHYESK